ncbi:hypothetical protein FO519_002519 [Halicephalobus sp. NKZ332]|nr:hypothetical protein FO519_002519 [Halicephalobus sp. NKZ332]
MPVKSPKSTSKTASTKKSVPKDETSDLLLPEIRKFVNETLGFNSFTPVQKCAIKYFLNNYDCIVQAPTGSGKTLAYLLPLLQILTTKCKSEKDDEKAKISGLILVPGKELVKQVSTIIKPIVKELGFNLVFLVHGQKEEQKKFQKNCIVITTPLRFANLIETHQEVKTMLKSLEMLVIDEADRFIDADFKDATTKILGVLPKQRRTGLFSATQAKEVEDLVKFGLRNPVRLEVTGDSNTVVDKKVDIEDEKKIVTPSTLTNTYAVVDPSHKVLCLFKYLQDRKDKKILVFFSSRFGVLYFSRVLKLLFSGSREILSLHGRKFNRGNLISKFNKSKNNILLATDIAGRGLDLEHVDSIVQFDIPKHTSWFIHRIGRAGRNGEAGESIAIFTKQEEAYPEFLSKHEKIELKENSIIKKLTEDGAEKIRKKIIKQASTEREFLELGSVAFVAMLNAYLSHDSQIVAKLWDQDIGGLANAYGLLRIPKCNETRKFDLASFKNPEIETKNIPYKDIQKETERQEKLQNPQKLTKEKKMALKDELDSAMDDI